MLKRGYSGEDYDLNKKRIKNMEITVSTEKKLCELEKEFTKLLNEMNTMFNKLQYFMKEIKNIKDDYPNLDIDQIKHYDGPVDIMHNTINHEENWMPYIS